MAIKTLPKALLNMVEKQPNRIAMRRKDYGIWHDITWTEYLENVKHVTLGLHALGVKYGEHVAIIGENRPEWLYSALGIVCAGGAWVGVYTTNPVAECEYVVGHSDAVVYICEDEEQLDKALAFRDQNTQITEAHCLGDGRSQALRRSHAHEFRATPGTGQRRRSQKSGSLPAADRTGDSLKILPALSIRQERRDRRRGPCSRMRVICGSVEPRRQVMPATNEDETISFLPLNHVYEQIFDMMFHLTVGQIVNFTENTDTVMADMQEISPTMFHAVPRIWEKYYSGIVLKMADATWLKRTLYKIAVQDRDPIQQ